MGREIGNDGREVARGSRAQVQWGPLGILNRGETWSKLGFTGSFQAAVQRRDKRGDRRLL